MLCIHHFESNSIFTTIEIFLIEDIPFEYELPCVLLSQVSFEYHRKCYYLTRIKFTAINFELLATNFLQKYQHSYLWWIKIWIEYVDSMFLLDLLDFSSFFDISAKINVESIA